MKVYLLTHPKDKEKIDTLDLHSFAEEPYLCRDLTGQISSSSECLSKLSSIPDDK